MSEKCIKCGTCINDDSNYCPNCGNSKKEKVEKPIVINNYLECYLSIAASFCLAIGIIASFILLGAGMYLVSNYDEELGYALMIKAAYILPFSIIIGISLKVLCNISNNLHEINIRMKK